jgi:hypothetical protein
MMMGISVEAALIVHSGHEGLGAHVPRATVNVRPVPKRAGKRLSAPDPR